MAKKIETTVNGSTLTFQVLGIDEPLTLDASTLAQPLVQAAVVHGLRQKVSDAAAGKDPQDAYAAMADVIGRLSQGQSEDDWNAARAAGEGTVRATLLAEAMVILAQDAGQELSVADAIDVLEGMPDEDKKNLRANPLVKQAIDKARLARSEKAAAKADVENPLASFLS